MTSGPRLRLGPHLLRGIGAVALFAFIASVVIRTPFAEGVGFPAGENITASIGYALIGLPQYAAHETEGFLVALIVIAVALDAALDGAVMLARRDVGGRIAGALRSGGEEE